MYYIIFEENKYMGKPIGIVKCNDIDESFYTHNSWDSSDGRYYVTNVTFRQYITDKYGLYGKYHIDKYKNIDNFIEKHRGEI